MSSQTLGSNGLEGGRRKKKKRREEEEGNRRLKTQLSLQWRRPAGPGPDRALLWSLKCDTLNPTNRESVSRTETLTDRLGMERRSTWKHREACRPKNCRRLNTKSF